MKRSLVVPRNAQGGAYGSFPNALADTGLYGPPPSFEESSFGFRAASVVPEPSTALLVTTGMLGLAIWRKRRAYIG